MSTFTSRDRERLTEFLYRDPRGFMSALINTIDTHQELLVQRERPFDKGPCPTQQVRERWAICFLNGHDNGEESTI